VSGSGDPVGLLAGYDAAADLYDEAVDDGRPRPASLPALRAVAEHGVAELAERFSEDIARLGMNFRSVDGDESFVVDPVPRVIDAAEWEHIEAGLAQRVRALDAFVADAYGERRIVAEGVIPDRVIETATYYEPVLDGLRPPGGLWVAVAGPDLVRDPDGELLVLEDNLRSPSGFIYTLAVREALAARLDVAPADAPRSLDDAADWLAEALAAAAPERAGDDPRAIVLTDGTHSSAYWEHRWLATHLDIPLASPHELEQRDRRLWLRPPGAPSARPVDVVYNRTSTDHMDTPLGQLMLDPLRAGTLAVVNAFGAGVGDDKLTHAYVEDMIRFYLGQEPLVRSVQTFDLARSDHLEQALDRFGELVIKPRAGHGGIGVLVCPLAEDDEVDAMRDRVRADPAAWIAQPTVELSTHATLIDGALAQRHVDLRPFVFMHGPDRPRVMPGGLTRFARDEGQLVVNSIQNGGFKDTWVLDR
jgi:uncharacterized circularly permuted ATP-grasp superfamily protein